MIAKKLKMARKNKKFTQQDVANEFNISRQSVSKWENGICLPNIETLNSLAYFYEISINDLLKENTELKKTLQNRTPSIETKNQSRRKDDYIDWFFIPLLISLLILFYKRNLSKK